MYAVFLFFLIISSLSNPIFSMTVQEGPKVPSLSDQEFKALVYPISSAQKTDYEAARKELQARPESEAARKRLTDLAEQGYIPALRDLTSNEIRRGDLSKAIHLSLTAARLGDPSCALTVANLYAAHQESDAETALKDEAIHGWLRCASLKRIIVDENTQNLIGIYTHPLAKQHAHAYLQAKQENYEDMIAEHCAEQLAQWEKDAMSGELVDLPFLSYLIKKNSQKGTLEPAKRALGIAEKMINHEQFDDDYLHAAGVRAVVEKLCYHSSNAIQKRAQRLCQDWDKKESPLGKIVSVLPPQAKKRFVKSGDSATVINDLMSAAPRDFEGVDCVNAALYLYDAQIHNESKAALVKAYLDHALQDSNAATRHALIEKCRHDKMLVNYASRALVLYASELAAKGGLLQEETDFMNKQLKMLMSSADQGSGEAALEVYYLITNCADCFNIIPMEKRKAFEVKYFKKAFGAGNYTALCSGANAARSFKLETSAEFANAMKFWAIAYNVASAQSSSSEVSKNLPAPHELAAQAYQNILDLGKKKLEIGEGSTIEDAEFYYYMTSAFAHKNTAAALDAFSTAINIVNNSDDPRSVELFERTGVKDLLAECMQRGKGWAHFAHGLYTFTQAIKSTQNMDHQSRCEHVINELQKARGCLMLAAKAPEPQLDYSIFNEAYIDAYLGAHYYDLFRLNKAERTPYLATALSYLKASADQLNPKGLLGWATITLFGDGDIGQAPFEMSINYLMKAACQDHKEFKDARNAMQFLEKMESDGLFYLCRCGGVMTLDLLHAIKSFLAERRKSAGMVSPHLAQEAAIANASALPDAFDARSFYARSKEKADKGDIEAMVTVATLLRDGAGVEQSAEQSQEYFIRALLAWDGVTHLENAIAFGCRSIENSSKNVRASVALTKALIADSTILGSLTIIPGNPAHNKRVIQNRNSIINSITNAQRLMIASQKKEERDLLFTSGLADLIARRCDPRTEGVFLMRIAQLYIGRMIAFPEEIAVESEKQRVLFKPFSDLERRLKEALFHEDFAGNVKNEEIIKILDSFIADLASLISVSPAHKSKFEYLLGLCGVYRAIQNKTAMVEQINRFKRLAAQGDLEAEYMLGYLTLYGNELNPEHMRPNADQGITLLEQLGRQKKYPDALLVLAKYYLKKSQSAEHPKQALNFIKKEEKYLLEILNMDATNKLALISLAELYFYNPKIKPLALQDEEIIDSARNDYICTLLTKIGDCSGHIELRVKFYQSLMVLRDENISDAGLKQLEELLSRAENNNVIATLLNLAYKERDLIQQIDNWCKGACSILSESADGDPYMISRIYSICGWLHSVVARSTVTPQLEKRTATTDIQTRASERANEFLQKALDCKRVHPLAHIIKTSLVMRVENADKDDYVPNARKFITATTTVMQRDNLNLRHVPLFKTFLDNYLQTVLLKKNPKIHAQEAEYIKDIIQKLS